MMDYAVIVTAAPLAANHTAAQTMPWFETYFSYSYVGFDLADNLRHDSNKHAGTTRFTCKFNPWLGLPEDLVGYLATGTSDAFGNIWQAHPIFAADNQRNWRIIAGLSFLLGGEVPWAPQAAQPATRVCPDGSSVAIDAFCPQLQIC